MRDVVGAQAPELTLQVIDPLVLLTKEMMNEIGFWDEPLEVMVQAGKDARKIMARKEGTVDKPKWTTRADMKRVVVHLKPRRTVSLRSRAAVSINGQSF